MHTPSLARRVVLAGVAVVAVLLVGLDLLLYLSLRSNRAATLDGALDNDALIVRDQAAIVGTDALPLRLAQLGVVATVHRPDGSVVPGSADPGAGAVHRLVTLAGGATADVTVSRAAADASLRRLVYRELVLTPLVVALAVLLLRLVADVAMRPLDQIATAARRTARGSWGERLRPHPTGTRLGRMALAYDEMLDALEAAVVDSRRAQRHSDRLKARYQQVLDTAHDAFVAMDSTGRVVEWNGQAEHIFGWSAAEALGRPVADLIILPEYRETHCGELTRFLLTGSSDLLGRRLRHEGRRRSGDRFPMEISAWATHDDGTATFNAFIRDITEEQRVATRLDATLGALEVALYESQASEAASRRFLDDAAHQLRTPITGIRASAETLMRGVADPEDQRRLLGAVVREASRAGRLMAGLLQMARLNSDRRLVLEPCDLRSLCQDEADRMFYVAPHLQVVVGEAGPRPATPPRLDRNAVGEILANLLDNATRHARSRVTVTVRWDPGTAESGRGEHGRVEVHVADDGSGLSPEMAAVAFDRFVSLDGKGGSGLGLPIARALARAHDGDLVYEDRAFVVRLPAGPDAPAPVSPQ